MLGFIEEAIGFSGKGIVYFYVVKKMITIDKYILESK